MPDPSTPRRTTATRLDALEAGQGEVLGELRQIRGRVDVLNGEKPHLRALAAAAPKLVELAENAPELIATAKERADAEAYRRVRARRWGWIGRLDIARPWLYLGVAVLSAGVSHWLATAHLLGF